MTKKKAIYIRVTSDERKHIQSAAKDAGLSVTKLGAALLISFADHRAQAHSCSKGNSDKLLITARRK